MPFTSGKQAFLEILKQEGVEIMFGNPGTTELPLMDGLAREPGIRYILALQESVAIAMADGYAQASGKLAAVNVHTSPGLGNAMGMLYDAMKAGSPLLLTAGPARPGHEPHRAHPLVRSAAGGAPLRQVVARDHAARRSAARRAPRRQDRARRIPPGPVFISLPVDVLNAEQQVDLLETTRVAPRIRGDKAAIEAAADLLVKAQRPVLISGDAVAHGDALAEMAEVAELLGAPVYAECVPSTCSFPFTHPLYAGAFPRLGQPIRQLLMKHDLLFSVGGDIFTLSLPSDVEPMPEGLPLIHLDLDPWEIGKNYPAKVAIQGDPKATLPDLAEALRRRLSPDAAQGREGAHGGALRKARRRGSPSAAPGGARRRKPGCTPITPAVARGRGGGRGARRRHRRGREHLLGRRPARAPASRATPRASTVCAAAASAGACRRRSASSWPSPAGPSSRWSATAARCTRSSRSGPPRTTRSRWSTSSSTTRPTASSSSGRSRSRASRPRTTSTWPWTSSTRASTTSGSPSRWACRASWWRSRPTWGRPSTAGSPRAGPYLVDVRIDGSFKS